MLRLKEESHALVTTLAEKDIRINALMTTTAEAEARAAASALSEAAYQAHAARLLSELDSLRRDLGLQVRSEVAELGNAASVMHMLRTEASALRGTRDEIIAALAAKDSAVKDAESVSRELSLLRNEHAMAVQGASLAQAQVSKLHQGLCETQALLEDALAGREKAMTAAAEARLALRHAVAKGDAAAADAAEAERQLQLLRAQAPTSESLLLGLRGVGAMAAARSRNSPSTSRPASPMLTTSLKVSTFLILFPNVRFTSVLSTHTFKPHTVLHYLFLLAMPASQAYLFTLLLPRYFWADVRDHSTTRDSSMLAIPSLLYVRTFAPVRLWTTEHNATKGCRKVCVPIPTCYGRHIASGDPYVARRDIHLLGQK